MKSLWNHYFRLKKSIVCNISKNLSNTNKMQINVPQIWMCNQLNIGAHKTAIFQHLQQSRPNKYPMFDLLFEYSSANQRLNAAFWWEFVKERHMHRNDYCTTSEKLADWINVKNWEKFPNLIRILYKRFLQKIPKMQSEIFTKSYFCSKAKNTK